MSKIQDRAVLVVVDVQNGFIREASAPVVPVIADLVARWQAAGRDVVFTRYLNYPGSPFERLINWSDLMDSPQTDIVPELQPYAEKATAVIDKKGYGLFADAAGAALVAERGWQDIYVCGIATESCVLATCLGAFEADLTPWLVEDASASHAGQHVHDSGVLVTRRFIGEGQIIAAGDIPVELASSQLEACEA
ncbi:cysteine hydrolase [Spirillospora sp. NBC_01491]|uniref:cysteine hydrolase n=1 Tax=Spirillospora sp. NBC_01491 TaxID=2976007 RepID=UPI002E37515F|nr:cysteine hydrolase [Spirillospora sp. NBC_01491]